MCGRFTIQYTWAEYYEALNLIPASAKGRNDPPRYNVAPTQTVGFICADDGEVVAKDGRWGIVPFFIKAPMKKPIINARSETMHEKPSFKFSVKSKRCLIPASSYYEWTVGEDGGKDPHNIHLSDNEPFYFAGLWAHNDNLDLTSFTIITSAAHPSIEHIHGRMPIILKEDAWEPWIDKAVETDRARELIEFNRGGELISYRVSRAVNKNSAQGAELIEPV